MLNSFGSPGMARSKTSLESLRQLLQWTYRAAGVRQRSHEKRKHGTYYSCCLGLAPWPKSAAILHPYSVSSIKAKLLLLGPQLFLTGSSSHGVPIPCLQRPIPSGLGCLEELNSVQGIVSHILTPVVTQHTEWGWGWGARALPHRVLGIPQTQLGRSLHPGEREEPVSFSRRKPMKSDRLKLHDPYVPKSKFSATYGLKGWCSRAS